MPDGPQPRRATAYLDGLLARPTTSRQAQAARPPYRPDWRAFGPRIELPEDVDRPAPAASARGVAGDPTPGGPSLDEAQRQGGLERTRPTPMAPLARPVFPASPPAAPTASSGDAQNSSAGPSSPGPGPGPSGVTTALSDERQRPGERWASGHMAPLAGSRPPTGKAAPAAGPAATIGTAAPSAGPAPTASELALRVLEHLSPALVTDARGQASSAPGTPGPAAVSPHDTTRGRGAPGPAAYPGEGRATGPRPHRPEPIVRIGTLEVRVVAPDPAPPPVPARPPARPATSSAQAAPGRLSRAGYPFGIRQG